MTKSSVPVFVLQALQTDFLPLLCPEKIVIFYRMSQFIFQIQVGHFLSFHPKRWILHAFSGRTVKIHFRTGFSTGERVILDSSDWPDPFGKKKRTETEGKWSDIVDEVPLFSWRTKKWEKFCTLDSFQLITKSDLFRTRKCPYLTILILR